ncbi:Acetylcholine receptor subunit alpha-type acr-16 [Portunus trituberculatus]|uniref:Acetylcholine receptor subunit alpha-type acr-16 n=1 Tax=Portunus trituberculatus TaxID=210409 RepID=A0A5B7G1E7_PORTR|nr:Acetylcholine receptor subunit alpha-type acr-16 [Portunus trituberculatus]
MNAQCTSVGTRCLPGHHERRLLNDLLKDYNKLERPTQNESSAIVVKLGLTLQQIINVVSRHEEGGTSREYVTGRGV